MESQIRNKNSNRKGNNPLHNQEQDYFSNLPIPIIIYIFSFLDMQDVVKTSVLSKTLKTLWTQVYNIVLHRVGNSNGELKMSDKSWIYSLDRTLMQCNAEKINKFCLIGNRNYSFVIDRWVKHIMDREVKILKLTGFIVPPRIFQSSSIIEMELVKVRLEMAFNTSSCPIHLTKLESLLIDNMQLNVNDEFIRSILIGCPVLESLALRNVRRIHEIKIMSPKLKKFILCDLDNTNLRENDHGEDVHESKKNNLEIKAPWLEELEILGQFLTTRFELVDVSSLRKATITFESKFQCPKRARYGEEIFGYADRLIEYNEKWIPMVQKVLSLVSHVNELIIGPMPIQVLSICKVLGTASPLFKCKHVSVETCLSKYELPGIAYLLENAPHVETMFIKVLDDAFQVKTLLEAEDPHLGMPNGKFPNLKNVKIDNWPYRPCRNSTVLSRQEFLDFQLVEYILRSAVNLDKLVLSSSGSMCRFRECPGLSCSLQCVPRLSDMIRTLMKVKKPTEWDVDNSKKNMYEFTFQKDASLHLLHHIKSCSYDV